ncbi:MULTISPECIES: hypothetical protein [Streptomyces]
MSLGQDPDKGDHLTGGQAVHALKYLCGFVHLQRVLAQILGSDHGS